MSLGEIIKTALLDTAIGMGTVFLILIIVSLCIWVLGKLCYKPEKPAKVEAAADRTAEATAMAAASDTSDIDSGDLDPQLAAVIAMTAIKQFMKDNNSEDEYIVRKVRRSTWKHTS